MGFDEVINKLECIEDYCKKTLTQLHLIQYAWNDLFDYISELNFKFLLNI